MPTVDDLFAAARWERECERVAAMIRGWTTDQLLKLRALKWTPEGCAMLINGFPLDKILDVISEELARRKIEMPDIDPKRGRPIPQGPLPRARRK